MFGSVGRKLGLSEYSGAKGAADMGCATTAKRPMIKDRNMM
jgi:hypothetical protein